MDTSMVRQSGFTPAASFDDGAQPTLRLIADPNLENTTGQYFDRYDDQPAHPQAYDAQARARLAALTTNLTAPFLA
ncbi:hypothetical protein ACFV8T_38070 [Streptomyces sp. NPDC059832]|uniref:hypothetical protein n=1 Tax=Streptomyces sp. NPDC059832 TaxID=3346966 RepID=UPI00365E5AF6